MENSGKNKLRLALLLVSLALAAMGQFFLASRQSLPWGLALYGAAVIAAVFPIAGETRLAHLWLEGLRPFKSKTRGKTAVLLLVAVGSLVVALFLCGWSLWHFGRDANSPSGWPPFLASLAALTIAILVLRRFQREHKEVPERPSGLSGNVTSLAMLLALFLLLAVALYLRIHKLGSLPYGLWGDEGLHGLMAVEILDEPSYRPVYIPEVNSPSLFVYLQALSIKWIGQTTFAVRLPSAILSAVTVWLFFLLARELFNSRVALAGAFLMAVSFWFTLWGRSGMPGVTPPFVTVLAVLFLIRALRYGRLPDYLWAGLALGAAAWFYTALLLFPLVGAVFLVCLLVTRRRLVRRAYPGLVVCAAAALLAASPVLEYVSLHHSEFWDRTKDVVVFRDKPLSESLKDMGDNLRLHLLMFNYRGDSNGRHNLPGEPLLDFGTGVLAVLGLAYCVRHLGRPTNLLLVLWFALMLVPAILSQRIEAPHSLRAVGTLPAVYLLALVPVRRMWGLLDTAAVRPARLAFVALLLVGLVAIGYLNYAQYFQRYSTSRIVWEEFPSRETYISHRLAELGDREVDTYTTSVYIMYVVRGFLAPESRPPGILDSPEDLPVPIGSRQALLFVDPRKKEIWERVQQCYSGAQVTRFQGPDDDGPPFLFVVDLDADELREGIKRCPRLGAFLAGWGSEGSSFFFTLPLQGADEAGGNR